MDAHCSLQIIEPRQHTALDSPASQVGKLLSVVQSPQSMYMIAALLEICA